MSARDKNSQIEFYTVNYKYDVDNLDYLESLMDKSLFLNKTTKVEYFVPINDKIVINLPRLASGRKRMVEIYNKTSFNPSSFSNGEESRKNLEITLSALLSPEKEKLLRKIKGIKPFIDSRDIKKEEINVETVEYDPYNDSNFSELLVNENLTNMYMVQYGIIIGFVASEFHSDDESIEIANVHVHPDYRGLGFCKKMLVPFIRVTEKIHKDLWDTPTYYLHNIGGIPACFCYAKSFESLEYVVYAKKNKKDNYQNYKSFICNSVDVPPLFMLFKGNF
jgi:hypothetical protein